MDSFSLNGCSTVGFLPAVLPFIVDAFRKKTPEASGLGSPFYSTSTSNNFRQTKSAQFVRDVQKQSYLLLVAGD